MSIGSVLSLAAALPRALLTSSLLVPALGMPLLLVPSLRAGPSGNADLGAGPKAWEGLRSPYYGVRRDSERRLQHLPPAEGREVSARLLQSTDPLLRRAAAGWLVGHIKSGGTQDVGDLVDALERETDPSVRDRLIDACIYHPAALALLRERFADERIPGAVLDRVADGRLILLLQDVMHEGRIPGFFDGQFEDALSFDPTAYGRLAYLAWNPRAHFVIRALSIMALHEAKRDNLAGVLGALVIDPRDEIDIQKDFESRAMQRVLDDGAFMRVLRANLSQYARFSLAKAGIAGPIEDKIAYMERWAERKLSLYEAMGLPTMDDNGSADWEFSEAMSMVFEVGYHYQQLDAYDQAEAAYRRVIDRPEPLRSKRYAHYNMACIRALQGNSDDAVDHLRKAFETGLGDPGWALRDGDLESLRDDERFLKLISDVLARRLNAAPEGEGEAGDS